MGSHARSWFKPSPEAGATAVEYALLVVLIAAVVVVMIAAIGQKLIPGFQAVVDGL